MAEESSFSRRDLHFPKLRYIEAIPHPLGSREGVCIRDPKQFAENVLVLPPAVFYIVTLFDGEHSWKDIQTDFSREFGQLIPLEKIEEIVEQLDRELFLESSTFERHKRNVIESFCATPFREAIHAGSAYEGDSLLLHKQLDGFVESIQDKKPVDNLPENKDLSLLISPHIDLHRGGSCFAYAYRELARHDPADLYIILGTGHQSEQSLISMTRKSYVTPLGVVETDVSFVDQFSRSVSTDVFAEEILHRDEHSVEFQVLWLRKVLGDSWKGKVVPILCGSFHPYVMKGISPREDRQVSLLLDTFRSMIEMYPGKVAVIAGVDLSHVGKRFGHPHGIPPRELDRVERDDQEVLNAIRSGNAETFYRSVEKKKDRNHICGLSPIYISLDIVQNSKGYLLNYDRAIEEDSESVVTFASFSFYREK